MKNPHPLTEFRYHSTKDLAKLLQVNESTIRRWADAGMLKCFKTPGGHRKFTPRHLSEFLRKFGYELLSSIDLSQEPSGD